MKIKASELTGATLDWAVAKCEGCSDDLFISGDGEMLAYSWQDGDPHPYHYSTNWALAGPIIEREGIELKRWGLVNWRAIIDLNEGDAMVETQYGPTPLIAAMRCYVASKLGDEVEIPDELK